MATILQCPDTSLGVLVLYMIYLSYSYFATHEIYVLCGWLGEHLQAEKAGKTTEA